MNPYKIVLHFEQEADDLQEGGDTQTLVAEVVDAGNGPYYVLTTDRWTLDEKELYQVVNTLITAKTLMEGKSE